MKDVTVLMPAYQEEEAIGKVIDEVRSVLPDCRILVAYQPSTDGTEAILKEKGVDYITEPKRGKGFAVRSAIRHVDSPYVVMINSDYTYPATHIPELLENLTDVCLGYRHNRADGAMSAVNFVGNVALSLIASALYRRRVYDVCTGLWAFRTDVLKSFALESGGFMLEVDLFVNCARHKCKISQVPVGYRRRQGDSMSKLRVTDGLKIGMFLIKKRLNVLEGVAYRLCSQERCLHYQEATKYPRKCYYGPQCWRGKISSWTKRLRVRRYG